MTTQRPKKEKAKKSTTPMQVDEATLHKLAITYLNRFDASTSKLRAVLMEKVKQGLKAADSHDRTSQTVVAAGHIQALIERFQSSGVLNDQRFTQHLVSSWRARGLSAQAIHSRLRAKGIEPNLGDAALATHSADLTAGGSELDAAITFAKKRKLGCFGANTKDRAQVRKDLARMARAGFAFDVAVRALSVTATEDDAF